MSSEVPISQYPLLCGEPASWPDDEGEEKQGGEMPLLAAAGGAPREAIEVQDVCKRLGLPTSGSKSKVLRRLQQYKHQEEDRTAVEITQKLFAENRREAIPIKVPSCQQDVNKNYTN